MSKRTGDVDEQDALIAQLIQSAKAEIAATFEPGTKLDILPDDSAPDDSRFLSHFGGQPYFEAGESWPVNVSDGTPLDLVCQIINDGTMIFPPGIELFQFWFDWEKMPRRGNQEGWLVKMYKDIKPDQAISLPRPSSLPARKYCTVSFHNYQTVMSRHELGELYFRDDLFSTEKES